MVITDGSLCRKAGSGAAAGASVGAALGGGAGLLAGLGLLAIPGLGPVVAAGWLAATAVGAVAGGAAGGLVGSLTSAGVNPEHAEIYAEGVRRGGSIVTARVDDTLAPRAESLLSDRGAIILLPAVRPIADQVGSLPTRMHHLSQSRRSSGNVTLY